MGDGGRNAPSGGLNPLGREQLGDERAEHDRFAVGDEVGVAGSAAGGAEHQPLDGVVYVRGRGSVSAAADPRKAAGAHELDDRRQQGRVTVAPDEPRANHDGLKPVPVRIEHQLKDRDQVCPGGSSPPAWPQYKQMSHRRLLAWAYGLLAGSSCQWARAIW